MNNPGISSFINSNQNTTCIQQVDFEREINENIIPTRKSTNPTELNVCNENTVDNMSPSVETLTCLQEFDKILDNVCENKVPIGINTQYEIDIEGVHLNDLATLGDINKSSVDNFDDWHNGNNFVKNTELNTVEHCSNDEEDRNRNYLEIPIDNNEHSNVNNHLDTWKSIYENFLVKPNDITGVSTENQIITEERIKNVLDDPSAIENNTTYYLNSEIRISKTPRPSANKTIKANLQTKKKIPNDFGNDPNTFEKPELKSRKCFKIHNKPTLTTEFKQDLESNVNKCLNYNKNPTNTFEFKKHEVESINFKYLEKTETKESSNTRELAEEEHEFKNNESILNIGKQSNKEFKKEEIDSDCDGYNSSDFEFIDEDEATKHSLNLKSLFDKSIYLKATTNNAPVFEVDTATTNNRPNFVCSEIKDENGAEFSPSIEPLPSIESLFAIHYNQKAINFIEFCDEENIILDYFKTVEPTVNVNEFDNSYRDSHKIPNDDEFINLFGGNFTPYPLFSFENKATHFGTGMTSDSGIGFDKNRFRDESTPEQRREAKESELKILAMYAIENRSPR